MHARTRSTFSPASGIVGDITPVCGVSDEEKFRLEEAALLRLKEMLGPVASAEEMESLWREYEAGSTAEAAIVKDFDKVPCVGVMIGAGCPKSLGRACLPTFYRSSQCCRPLRARSWR